MTREQNIDLDDSAFLSPELNLVKNKGYSSLYLQTFMKSPLDPMKIWSKPESEWHELARVYNDRIETFPIYTNPFAQRYLCSKNGKFSVIVYERKSNNNIENNIRDIESEIDNLSGWNIFDDCRQGLGLNNNLRDLWGALSLIREADTLIIKIHPSISKNKNEIHLSIKEIDDIRRAFNRGNRNKNDKLRLAKRNYVKEKILTVIDPIKFPELIEVNSVRPLVELKVNRVSKAATAEMQKQKVRIIKKELVSIASDAPRELLELHADIERVTLSGMIDKFEVMLQGDLPEPKWQSFFEDNTFVLTMLFCRPVYLLHTQFNARSPNITGAGAQIGDFLFGEKSSSLAIIEIKKPSTELVKNGGPYRNNVYAPHYEVSGAITQVLTQKSSLQNQWVQLTFNNRSLNRYRSDVIKCIVLAGKTPEDEDKLNSFNLFRNSCQDVEVITYDELLDKLKILLVHLSNNGGLEG
ncbi:TPA: Shedu immune nuclease family protein [Aeromonas veronii]